MSVGSVRGAPPPDIWPEGGIPGGGTRGGRGNGEGRSGVGGMINPLWDMITGEVIIRIGLGNRIQMLFEKIYYNINT
jgi:hypothetical protein